MFSLLDVDTYDSFMRLVYFPPWCRAAPWLVGIWGGMVIGGEFGTERKLKKVTHITI